jgi:hypothetical protein
VLPLGDVVTATSRERVIALDLSDGRVVRIKLWAPDDFDAFIAEAMPVVESFQFDLGAEASPS